MIKVNLLGQHKSLVLMLYGAHNMENPKLYPDCICYFHVVDKTNTHQVLRAPSPDR